MSDTAAIVLAAGLSRRMGEFNKLLLHVGKVLAKHSHLRDDMFILLKCLLCVVDVCSQTVAAQSNSEDGFCR